MEIELQPGNEHAKTRYVAPCVAPGVECWEDYK